MTIFSSFSANFTPHYHTILAINCPCIKLVTYLLQTRQIDGKNAIFCSYCECTVQSKVKTILTCGVLVHTCDGKE